MCIPKLKHVIFFLSMDGGGKSAAKCITDLSSHHVCPIFETRRKEKEKKNTQLCRKLLLFFYLNGNITLHGLFDQKPFINTSLTNTN